MMWTHIWMSLILWEIGFSITIDDCPNDLDRDEYLTVYGDKCYYFYRNVQREYDDAQEICQSKGGNLASVKTSAINDFIWTNLKKYDFDGNVWIGLSDQNVEGEYEWRDGSEMGYNNFDYLTGPNAQFLDPSNTFEDCVAIQGRSGKWADLRCNDVFLLFSHHEAFLCEYAAKSSSEHNSVPQATKDDCPKSVHRNEHLQVLDNTCYYFYVKSKMEFSAGQDVCKSHGGILASIKTERINNFIWNKLKSHYDLPHEKVWIGLRYDNYKDEFDWMDGSRVVYENFASGEGRGGSQPCVAMDTSNGQWRNYDCEDDWFTNRHRYYICEFPATPRTTTTTTSSTSTTTSFPTNTTTLKTNTPTLISTTTTKTNTTTTTTTTMVAPLTKPIDPATTSKDNVQTKTSTTTKTSGSSYTPTTITTTTSPQATKNDCPATLPRNKYLQVLDNTCYYFNLTSNVEFMTAQIMCRKHKGSLVSIKTERVGNFISKALNSTYKSQDVAWIGLRYVHSEGAYIWMDGGKMVYEHFGSGEGSGGVEPCVGIDGTSRQWKSFPCGYSLMGGLNKHFICEFPALPKTATVTH